MPLKDEYRPIDVDVTHESARLSRYIQVDQKKEAMLEIVEARLKQNTFSTELMRIGWKLV